MRGSACQKVNQSDSFSWEFSWRLSQPVSLCVGREAKNVLLQREKSKDETPKESMRSGLLCWLSGPWFWFLLEVQLHPRLQIPWDLHHFLFVSDHLCIFAEAGLRYSLLLYFFMLSCFKQNRILSGIKHSIYHFAVPNIMNSKLKYDTNSFKNYFDWSPQSQGRLKSNHVRKLRSRCLNITANN